MWTPVSPMRLICQVDLYASFASLLGQNLASAAPDSEDLLPVLLGKRPAGRASLITEGIGAKTAFHQHNWVLIPPHSGPALNTSTNTELGNSPEPQLYDLTADIGQMRKPGRPPAPTSSTP